KAAAAALAKSDPDRYGNIIKQQGGAMSSGTTNKIVTSTVNIVSWEISRSSYEAAKKKILSLQQLTTKPAKALEQAQKRTAQSEGKAALEAARAQTQRLKMAQKL